MLIFSQNSTNQAIDLLNSNTNSNLQLYEKMYKDDKKNIKNKHIAKHTKFINEHSLKNSEKKIDNTIDLNKNSL